MIKMIGSSEVLLTIAILLMVTIRCYMIQHDSMYLMDIGDIIAYILTLGVAVVALAVVLSLFAIYLIFF
jgi:branched-subunit amino acid transport protein AzlD